MRKYRDPESEIDHRTPQPSSRELDAVKRALAVRWNAMPAASGFKRWVDQLARARRSVEQPELAEGCAKDLETKFSIWSLVGQGVVFEHEDGDEACEFLSLTARAAQMSYVEIPAHEVVSTFEDWRSLMSPETPTLLHLQAGDWINEHAPLDDEALFTHEPVHDSSAAAIFRQSLVRAMAEDLQGKPVVLVVAVSKSDKLADEFRTSRQFCRLVSLPAAESRTHGQAFLALCEDLPWDTSVHESPADVGAVVRSLSMNQRLQLFDALRHTAWREDRPLTQRDLLECKLFGMRPAEPDSVEPLSRWRTAVHEAGHVLMEFLASGGTSIAAFCSILDHGEAMGVVVPMHDHPKQLSQGERTYGDLLQELQVCLAGRAAEHMLLGPLEISATGSTSDLERAGRLANKMIGRRGLPVSDASNAAMSVNLLVIFGAASDCEIERQSSLARQLLQDQYLIVLEELRRYESLLTQLASRLEQERVLTHKELEAILRPFSGAP